MMASRYAEADSTSRYEQCYGLFIRFIKLLLTRSKMLRVIKDARHSIFWLHLATCMMV
jgi:hypothetical protein